MPQLQAERCFPISHEGEPDFSPRAGRQTHGTELGYLEKGRLEERGRQREEVRLDVENGPFIYL